MTITFISEMRVLLKTIHTCLRDKYYVYSRSFSAHYSSSPSAPPSSHVASSPPPSSSSFSSPSSSAGEVSGAQRESILRKALHHVRALGWTNEALIRGTMDSQLPINAFATINRGPVELVEYFLLEKKDEVLKSLQDAGSDNCDQDEHDDSKSNITVDTPILQLMMERNIDLLRPHLKYWPEALALLLEPKNIPYTMQVLFHISDELCEASGIRASRLNWYVERGSVLVLMCCSELYMLSDDSVEYADTRDFIKRFMSFTDIIKNNPIAWSNLLHYFKDIQFRR